MTIAVLAGGSRMISRGLDQWTAFPSTRLASFEAAP
jgi:hypothetical protein